MTKTFADKETAKVFGGSAARTLPPELQKRAKMRLDRIDAATAVNDLRVPPSHHLEKLSGDRAGQYSLRINQQWRICFVWRDGEAYDVEIVDYH